MPDILINATDTQGVSTRRHMASFNSLWSADANMRQGTGPTLVQVIVCRLWGTKQLSEPTMNFSYREF